MLVYQITLDFFILTFHPIALLNSHMNSNRLATAFLDVSIHTIVLSANDATKGLISKNIQIVHKTQ